MRLRDLALAPLAMALAAPAQARHPITPQFIYQLQTVSAPALSPDGVEVAYVVQRADRAHNRWLDSIWIAPTDGTRPAHALIASGHAPAWSPDGKGLAFLARAGAKLQVWEVNRDGSLLRQLTRVANGVSAYRWSPDGTQLAVVSNNSPARLPDAYAYDSIFDKSDGHGWRLGDNHIWIVTAATGMARALTRGPDSGDSDPEWSPDGRFIAYISNRMGPELRSVGATTDLDLIPAMGGRARTLVHDGMYLGSPRWSPDGKWLAWAAAPTPDEQPRLYVAPAAGGPAHIATTLDLFPTQIAWDRTGHLWFAAHDRGTIPFFRVNLQTHGTRKVLSGLRWYGSLEFAPDGRLVYLSGDDTHPAELFTAQPDGSGQRQLTFQNRALLAGLDLAPMQSVIWKSSADGLPIQGFLTRPLHWVAGRKYPMILDIHGGPNGMFGYTFQLDEQLYAAQGYAVLRANPRGSSGYGMAFQRKVVLQWGGSAYQDLMSGVTAMLAKNPWVDAQHLGVVGHSFGGFMTDWIVTQTHRFRAAISIAGIGDLISVEGTRDGAYGHARDFGGDVYHNFPLYWHYSAVRAAANVTTPILFLQGEADERVPLEQSEEDFRAVKHFGDTAELVVFPGESHMLPDRAAPHHLLETYQWRLYWFRRFVTGDRAAAQPTDVPEALK